MCESQRVREKPHEYACIGCNLKVSDHETVFERQCDREARGVAVGAAFKPLSAQPEIRRKVKKVSARYQALGDG